ncbi:hypothetical protein KUA24_28 [Vibrio phage HNL01]|nr:hypothetical protein KUA24_28 [Vibrio phage HNL01]
MKKHKETIESNRLDSHFYCIADEMVEQGIKNHHRDDYEPCGSSDACSIYEGVYEDESVSYSGYCFSCAQSFQQTHLSKSSLASDLGLSPEDGTIREKKVFEKKPKQPKITREQIKELWSRTTDTANGYRGLSDDSLKFYGFRMELNEDGSVKGMYFPETDNDGSPNGYKSRHHAKIFGVDNIGITGMGNQLSGQCRFPDGGRYVLITGGELDMIAAQDMLRDYQHKKNQSDYERYAVVSPTTGEKSAIKQCRAQYEWFDKFEIIIIGLDNDEVGIEAAEELAKVLPREKVKIAKWSKKDPNQMLIDGMQRQFMSDFFSAKEVVASGITSSANLMDNIKEALKRPRVPLPPVMSKLQDMTKGDGLICNRIYNLIGDTSVGKSTFINTISHHLFFEDTAKLGIVSLEASDGEYGADLLSYHLSTNLYWLEEDEALDYLEDPEVAEEAAKMLVDEYGESRFHVLDDRSGTFEGLKRRMEQLHRQYGCNVIIIDVLTDLLRTMGNEEQSAALNWMSNFVKNGITIINVLHTRKPPVGRGGIPQKPTEYCALGSSIFVQKAAGNVVIYRNKNCTNDPIEQNTTYWDVPKMRQGKTGDKIMAIYYDGDTRQTYDRDEYFRDNPDKLPVGYDLSVSSFEEAYYEEGGRGWNGISKNSFGGGGSRKKEKPVEPDIMDGVDL